MKRELEPADLLPAIQSVAGGLVVSLVLAEAARLAAEHELAELTRDRCEPMPAPNGRQAGATGPTAPAAFHDVP